MNSEKSTVSVNIYGMEYPIKGGGDTEYVLRVAKYVNDTMVDLDKTMQSKSSVRVAILAAMNIADQLFQAKEELQHLKEDINQRSQRLVDKVSRRLSP